MAAANDKVEVNESATALLTFTLVDDSTPALPIPVAALTTLTLTLYNPSSGTAINSRSAQNVLNANNVTVHATSGLVTWQMQVADNAVSTTLNPDAQWPDGRLERHRALWRWTYNAGAKAGNYELDIDVLNRFKIP